MLLDPKSTERYENNINSATRCAQKVIDILYNLGKDEGEIHAACFVCIKTTIRIRDLDLSLIHLPS